jgi:sterol desaturase/sphingolipid hydroxylase (fatty acid hydroxylase superfamily)
MIQDECVRTIMRLSKAHYFADFVVYPPAAGVLMAIALRPPSSLSLMQSLVALLAGLAAWTLVEYAAHRFVLHEVRFLAKMHEMHHKDPTGFVGTPTWVSFTMICAGALLPLWWEIGLDLASAFTAGIMVGYVWYVGVHHVVHHWRTHPGSYLYRLKHRHALHHHMRQPCNFGVSTALWDHVFGTAFVGR